MSEQNSPEKKEECVDDRAEESGGSAEGQANGAPNQVACLNTNAGEAQNGDDEDEEPLIIDPEATELDLNHRRLKQIQNLEPLTQIERLISFYFTAQNV